MAARRMDPGSTPTAARRMDPGRTPTATHRLGQDGFALVLVLLALALLTAIASAALAASIGQLRAAAMAGRVLSERTAAIAAVDALLNTTRGFPSGQIGGPPVELAPMPFGSGGSQRVLALRLTTEMHAFVGEAALDSGVPMRDARLVWWMDPEARIAAHVGAVEAGAVDMGTGATVGADSALTGRPGIAPCDQQPLLANARAASPLQVASSLPGPPAWGAGSDGADFARIRLGWFGQGALRLLADHPVAGGGTLPSVGCAGCWSGLVYSEGNNEVTGRGAGVLVVDGDLALASGSSWTGLVLVAGGVAVRGGARVQGLVRAGGRVTLEPGSVVDGSACSALRALQAASSLARPLPLPGRSMLAPLAPGSG